MSKGNKEQESGVSGVVHSIDERIEKTVKAMAPLRSSAFRRFPTVFTLLTTVGVVATFLGIEKILERYAILSRYPELMVVFGLGVLVFTGALYKKLG